jgi:hypothetical protein
MAVMMLPATRTQVANYLLTMTCSALDTLAKEHDIPLHTLSN